MKTIDAYDLVVCGAGLAGSMAATAAARMGASVLVIEEEGYPGGSMTACGTGPMMTFHAGEKQVIRGLTDEMVSRLAQKGLSPGHTVDSTGYTYTVTPFSAEGMKRELETMMTEAGAALLYHTVITGVALRDGLLERLTCFSCGETFEVTGRVFIDATGDGD
ncbi:MAG: FAD-dependent oxidoreductase, partial [Clostridiales bacterium]|nr:FAD-dependent oxidoreductase [Clostridiales bacterium]